MNEKAATAPKSLIDYIDFSSTFPMSHSTLFCGQFLILLKLMGELSHTPWKFPLAVWVCGIVLTLLRAWWRAGGGSAIRIISNG